MEQWKTIEDFPMYEISDKGNVKSLNYRRSGKEQVMKPQISNGCYYVSLRRDNTYFYRAITDLMKKYFPNTANVAFLVSC